MEDPYKTFFLTELEYPGYGRQIPEPEHVTAVKIGLVGPIVGSVSESVGGPEEVRLVVEKGRLRFLVTQKSFDALKWQPGELSR